MSTPIGEQANREGVARADPDFYLSSSEDLFWSTPRAVRIERPATELGDGREWLLIRVEPPVVGQPFGRGEDIDTVLVTPRFEGETLTPPLAFPLHVHVFVPPAGSGPLTRETLTHATWGELVASAEEARSIHERAVASDRFSA
ncbi:MAG: hypothetical protein LC713_01830 [Actinobacteria bacterium]|nr:hypothetical protein [Actinomycetota bacterium]